MKKTYYLKDLAHGRSGDKGDRSNICMFARNPEDYEFPERRNLQPKG